MKNILLHTVPVLALALGAIFGLTAEEQSTVTQSLTTIIGAVCAVIPIAVHMAERNKNKA